MFKSRTGYPIVEPAHMVITFVTYHVGIKCFQMEIRLLSDLKDNIPLPFLCVEDYVTGVPSTLTKIDKILIKAGSGIGTDTRSSFKTVNENHYPLISISNFRYRNASIPNCEWFFRYLYISSSIWRFTLNLSSRLLTMLRLLLMFRNWPNHP